MKYHFTYKTINPKTREYYIGVHSTTKPDKDGYQGSGDWVKECGVTGEHLVTGILEYFDTSSEAYAREALEVTWERISHDPLMMNKIIGGIGGWKGMTPDKCVERNKRVHSEDERRKRSNTLLSFYRSNKHHTTGRPKPPEQRRKMSESQKGREFSLETRALMSASQRKARDEGRITSMPPNNLGSTYQMKEVSCTYCGKLGKGGNMTRYHFDNCKAKTACA